METVWGATCVGCHMCGLDVGLYVKMHRSTGNHSLDAAAKCRVQLPSQPTVFQMCGTGVVFLCSLSALSGRRWQQAGKVMRRGRIQPKGEGKAAKEWCSSSYFAIGSDIRLSAKVNPSHMIDLTFAVIKSIIIQ